MATSARLRWMEWLEEVCWFFPEVFDSLLCREHGLIISAVFLHPIYPASPFQLPGLPHTSFSGKRAYERSIRQSISKTSTIMVRSMVTNIQKTKIRGSGPITSWQIDGETMETVRHFIFGCSKITVDGDCSHEIERRLLLGRKGAT